MPVSFDNATDAVNETLSGLQVRAFDIYVLGPFLIWAAMQKKPLGAWPRRALFGAGVYSVLYHLKDYRALKDRLQEGISP